MMVNVPKCGQILINRLVVDHEDMRTSRILIRRSRILRLKELIHISMDLCLPLDVISRKTTSHKGHIEVYLEVDRLSAFTECGLS